MKKLPYHNQYDVLLADYGLNQIDTTAFFLIQYQKNEFICEESYSLEYLLLIIKGKAKVCYLSSNGKKLLFAFYSSSGILGDVEFMLHNMNAISSVQAVTDVLCIAIPISIYEAELKQNINFLTCVGTSLANKLKSSSKSSSEARVHPLEARLCAYILITNEKGFFKENLTELSELLGTSYRHLLRTLDNLCKQNIIEKLNGGYMIKNISALQNKSVDTIPI